MKVYFSFLLLLSFLSLLFFSGCNETEISPAIKKTLPELRAADAPPPTYHPIHQDVTAGQYLDYMDSLAARYASLSEHLIVRANPWLIDRLEQTDYYRLMEQGQFVYDPQSLIVLHQGDSLLLPDSLLADLFRRKMENTVLDLNIPEFRIRIVEEGEVLYSFPVRVGRDGKRFLAMAGREVDLRTLPGRGRIVRINRDPRYINPKDNKPYETTLRDDGRRTKLPRIPWLEPELDGHRYGQLIHPTTNPRSLGRAYSNGCVGTGEAAAWRIYYYAPPGTRVVFRYDLKGVTEEGDSLQWKDIYPGLWKTFPRKEEVAALLAPLRKMRREGVCMCGWIE